MANTPISNFALFNLGFRPFFLGAALYSIAVMLIWVGVYAFNWSISMDKLSPYQWHAHEMVYGYAMAVIAGFLLTAVKNWTGIQTVYSGKLALIFFLWLIARILFLFGTDFIIIAGLFDLLFISALFVALLHPIIKSKNWKQLGILSKLLLLGVLNLCFYLGYSGHLNMGMYWAIYGGLYIVLGLILTIGSRVIPFFIERGVGYPVTLYNPKWVTITGLLLFLVFFISELFLQNRLVSGITAIGLFIVYSIRLYGWYTHGIWKKSLLWSLYLAMAFINIGFLLFALSLFITISPYIAIHAFAYGGIGIITVAMMARVSLGHTGRNINEPPRTVHYMVLLLFVGTCIRVFLPLLMPVQYITWIVISQLLWIAAFLLFVYTYFSILTKNRIDGQFG